MTAGQCYNRSPLFYVGDKFKLVPQLKKYFPQEIVRFIEPFCGGGSVFLNTSAEEFLLNDVNQYVISLHNFLIKHSKLQKKFWGEIELLIDAYQLSATYLNISVPQELKQQYAKTYFAQFNKSSYAKLRNDFNNNKRNMFLLYLLLIYGFNRMLRFNSKGDFNLPVGNVDFNENVVTSLNNYFAFVSSKKILLHSVDFEAFIALAKPIEGDFLYLDPPYLITFSEYNKFWNEQSDLRLMKMLDILHLKGIKFAISNVLRYKGRHNAPFEKWAEKYFIETIKSNYISFNDNTQKASVEVLVKNY